MNIMKTLSRIIRTLLLLFAISIAPGNILAESTPIWQKLELTFESTTAYGNPIYDVGEFYAEFTSPSGRILKRSGFWDGARTWKVRFMPDEKGRWSYHTVCSDAKNGGLHRRQGSFDCIENESGLEIYKRGPITLEAGSYRFRYTDGTPFFWLACTAWNGGLKSTAQEWEHYLGQRAELGYNVIQLVATQWRGCAINSRGEVAFTGCGRIKVNPGFFQLMDEKIDRVNAHGQVAAIVLLWALPFGEGRELSPGYYLPDQECIRLARYIVARYQANHVTWVLGGDGQYYGELEDRWKFIGKEVFRDDPPGPVTLHPNGRSWIGELYDDEDWYDYVGYQSTHGTTERHVNFINRTVAGGWRSLSPQPVINMEPCYEQIRNEIFEDDVRNACYWSVFAAPPSGVTYGHDGTWPWLREGEKPENHLYTPEVDTWDVGIELPGSRQVAYLGTFFRKLKWWEMRPAQELLIEQPGGEDYRHHISVLKSGDNGTLLVYVPVPLETGIRLPLEGDYTGEWFNPVSNDYRPAALKTEGRVVRATNPFEKDGILVLRRVSNF